MRRYIILFTLLLCACTTPSLLIDESLYKTTLNGKEVRLYTLSNGEISVQITNYGGRIVSLIVPDRNGEMHNIVWQEPSIDSMLHAPYAYSGALMGRCTNRIDNGGEVKIDNRTYQLSVNADNQHAHGGDMGFSFCVWDATQSRNKEGEPTLTLERVSKDGEEGYPGNLLTTAEYRLTSDNSLVITLTATTDAATIVNITSHPFFNLHGDSSISTNSHFLTIYTDKYTPSNSEKVLTGEIASVENTPLDFRTPHTISERIGAEHPQLTITNGYDTNYLLKALNDDTITINAELYEPSTGISLKLYSDQSALQFYAGPCQNQSSLDAIIKAGKPIRYGVTLEAQGCPNAPNYPLFPQCTLHPGEIYEKTIVYNFGLK